MRPKEAVDCYACGHTVESLDPERIIRRGNGWVNYRCPSCGHIMRIFVEEENEEPE